MSGKMSVYLVKSWLKISFVSSITKASLTNLYIIGCFSKQQGKSDTQDE